MKSHGYQKYVKEQRLIKIEKINNIVLEKAGLWINKDSYDGIDYPCKLECQFHHKFTITSRRLESRTWCPFCRGTINIGEEISRVILESLLGFPLEKTRKLPGLKSNKTSYPLELDGYNDSKKIAFEYQGIQHRKYVPYIHKNKAAFQNQLEHDLLKNQYCKNNMITLIEINEFKTFNPNKLIKIIIDLLNQFKITWDKTIQHQQIINKINDIVDIGLYHSQVNSFLIKNNFQYISGNFRKKDSKIFFLHTNENRICFIRINTILNNQNINIINFFICNKTNELKVKKSKYNIDLAISIITQYSSISQLKKEQNGLVQWLLLNKISRYRNDKIYTNEELRIIALNFKSRISFKSNNYRAYRQSVKYGIIDEICDHMTYKSEGSKFKPKYSDDYLVQFAQQFASIKQIRLVCKTKYNIIMTRKLQKIAFAHMKT